MATRDMATELRHVVASWNAVKREAAAKSAASGMTSHFTNLHNEQTRRLISLLGIDSAAWWEGLQELALNASHLIRSENVNPNVRILDPEDVRQRGAINGSDHGA